MVDEVAVLFEPDEERNYRALVSAKQLDEKGRNLTRKVLRATAAVLEGLRKRIIKALFRFAALASTKKIAIVKQ